jgi:Uri superfamily endonuclease
MDRRKPVYLLMENISAESGSYLLLTRLLKDTCIRIGALGVCNFESGFYFYCGSARGSGGLSARIHHHLRPNARASWHFDYLKPNLMIDAAWFVTSNESLECSFVKSLCRISQANQPVRFFGSRDCRKGCFSHLVGFPLNEDLGNIFESIKNDFSGIKVMPVLQIC